MATCRDRDRGGSSVCKPGLDARSALMLCHTPTYIQIDCARAMVCHPCLHDIVLVTFSGHHPETGVGPRQGLEAAPQSSTRKPDRRRCTSGPCSECIRQRSNTSGGGKRQHSLPADRWHNTLPCFDCSPRPHHSPARHSAQLQPIVPIRKSPPRCMFGQMNQCTDAG